MRKMRSTSVCVLMCARVCVEERPLLQKCKKQNSQAVCMCVFLELPNVVYFGNGIFVLHKSESWYRLNVEILQSKQKSDSHSTLKRSQNQLKLWSMEQLASLAVFEGITKNHYNHFHLESNQRSVKTARVEPSSWTFHTWRQCDTCVLVYHHHWLV